MAYSSAVHDTIIHITILHVTGDNCVLSVSVPQYGDIHTLCLCVMKGNSLLTSILIEAPMGSYIYITFG